MQVALKEATDVKFAREGEVTFLRNKIEKVGAQERGLNSKAKTSQVAQDHAAQILQLKSAKDAANTRLVQMQVEMKEEVERLKTQFIFKV
jgi:hypothetical protein